MTKFKISKDSSSLIHKNLKHFIKNESASTYKNFDYKFRELLQVIQNKKRVDRKISVNWSAMKKLS